MQDLAGAVNGGGGGGSYVCYKCDNQNVVDILLSQYSRDDDLTHLLRCLFFVEAVLGFNFLPVHISDVHNDLADLDQLVQFYFVQGLIN